jgi:hypothetical protein
MPGDPTVCRSQAKRCGALAQRAWTPTTRHAFRELSETWRKLAAENESDEALFATLLEMDLGEPYEALPRALKLLS